MRKFSSLLSTAFVASLFVVATSCKDDDDQKSRTDLLTGKSWTVVKAQAEVNGQFVDVPGSDYVSACSADNAITFTKAGAYKQTAGADDCNGDETEESGTWAWKDNEGTIALTIKDGSDTYLQDLPVLSLSESELKVQIDTIPFDTNGDGKDDAEVKIYLTLQGK
ncbi:MAG TPA: lipocalin family protein [Chryseolinea sp.]